MFNCQYKGIEFLRPHSSPPLSGFHLAHQKVGRSKTPKEGQRSSNRGAIDVPSGVEDEPGAEEEPSVKEESGVCIRFRLTEPPPVI